MHEVDLYMVLEGTKVASIYSSRDDADKHAQVVGGRIVVTQLKRTTPPWVEAMLKEAREKARLQNPPRR